MHPTQVSTQRPSQKRVRDVYIALAVGILIKDEHAYRGGDKVKMTHGRIIFNDDFRGRNRVDLYEAGQFCNHGKKMNRVKWWEVNTKFVDSSKVFLV